MHKVRTSPKCPVLQVASTSGHLRADGSVGDLLGHPAFRGFAPLLLPWDNQGYDEDMRLSEIGSLLPYYTHVDPAVTLAGLNRMIDDVNAGKAVFHDVYTGAQGREQPAKVNTGLFFFPGRPGAPFAIISPGGGFSYVGSVHEGLPYAAEISKEGYNAFILKHRAGHGERAATEDLAAAVSYVFRHAAALGVGTDGYSLWGSSAGARMAATIGSHGAADHGGDDVPRPSTVVMAYTARQDHSADQPSTFVVVGERDGIAPPSVMERRVAVLRRAGTRVELRKYRDLGHGFGPGTGASAEGWVGGAIRFWEGLMKVGQPSITTAISALCWFTPEWLGVCRWAVHRCRRRWSCGRRNCAVPRGGSAPCSRKNAWRLQRVCSWTGCWGRSGARRAGCALHRAHGAMGG